MTTNKLKKLIDQAVELDRVIRENEAELKTLKEALKAEAETRPEEHAATDGGGWSWQFAGESGSIARVTQEGDKLKSSISTEKDVAAAKDAAGPVMFRALFEPTISYKPVAKIREAAAEALEKPAWKKLLKILTGKGRVLVAFETKGGEA
jgi:hypothetical protein